MKTSAPTPRDREVFELLRAVINMKNSEIARKAGISASTIAKWRKPVKDGGTRHPQLYTMQKVARAAGMVFKLVPRTQHARVETSVEARN